MKTVLAMALMLVAASAAAQVNKCIDKSGKVVGYAAECPAGSRSEQLQIQKGPSAAAAQKSLADRDAEFKKRQVESSEATKKDEQKRAAAEQQKAACTQAQTYLRSLEAGQRVTRTDPKSGERVFINDTDYPGEMAKARASIAQNCK